MQLDRFVQTVQRDLAAAVPEDSAAAEHAERLATALDSSLRLAFLTALSAAADELSAELAPGSVSVHLSGGEPTLRASGLVAEATQAPSAPERPEPGAEWDVFPGAAPSSAGEERETARFNLRLPEDLKAQAEALAAQAGQSLNTWLVKAVGFAVATAARPAPERPQQPPRHDSRQRVTGWMN